MLNIFRTLIYSSSGACDCVVELPHRSSCSQFVVCWRFGAAGIWWCSFCRLKPDDDVVIYQHSRKLLKMDILMSETCWAHKKWSKTASDIKLVFHSSTITMMHGPINIRNVSVIYYTEPYYTVLYYQFIESKCGMINGWWIRMHLEGNNRGLFQGIFPEFTCME